MDRGTRDDLLGRLAEAVGSVTVAHPTRVAIDGPPAAGKTTLADELAGVLRTQGRNVIRATIDDFLVPRAQRYRRRLRQLTGVTSERPVALVVALSGTRIRPAVESFCASFAQPLKLYEVQRPGGLTQADFPRVLFELQSLKNRLMDGW